MPVRENAYYWEYSLENLEPEVDEEPYVHDRLIIKNARYLAEVNNLRDLLTTYCVLSKIDKTNISFAQEETSAQTLDSDKHSEILKSARRKVLKEIDRLLRNIKNIQHTEFVAFFKCFGMSHSIYRKKADDEQRLVILETILERYCKRRKSQYDRLGYTHVIQQALYDSAASRSLGSAAVKKLRQIIGQVSQEMNKQIVEKKDASSFCKSKSGYIFTTKNNFSEIKSLLGVKYEYGEINQNKFPDLAVRIGDKLFILEAKHIREPGGAQDKQVNELIEFIRQKEDNPISYIAFLDGRYFNEFKEASHSNKIRQQRDDIEKALRKYPNNYFVNTAGLRKLLIDLLSEMASDSGNQESRE